jgi:hypothetical protein
MRAFESALFGNMDLVVYGARQALYTNDRGSA